MSPLLKKVAGALAIKEIVDRVQIPVGRTIAGFGPGGAVYLLNRDGATATLEKASVR